MFCYVEFSNKSTADSNTVIVRDINNDGIVLKRGENYDVTGSGIHFYLLSIPANSNRGFTFEYFKQFDDAYNYGEAQRSVSGYVETTWNGLSFNTFSISWTNEKDTIFRGGLYIMLDFDEAKDVNPSSVRIWDKGNNQELSASSFIVGPGSIRIGADGLGDVNPGSGRAFDVYFLLAEYPGADPTELHLNTPIWTFNGFSLTPFFFIFLFGAILLGGSVYLYLTKKGKNKWWKGIAIAVFIIFIFYILAFMGI